MKIIRVDWEDAQTLHEEHSLEELKKVNPPIVSAIGVLVYEDKGKITLSSLVYNYERKPTFASCHTLSKRSIVKREVLGEWF